MSSLEALFRGMRISATGMSAERARIDVIAENIANVRTTSTADGGPYRRKLVVFEPMLQKMMSGELVPTGVRAARIIPDMNTPMEWIYEPSNPDANKDGYVEMPNVNTTQEMADLITAVRAYESNLSVEESFRHMAERALQLAR